MIIVIIMIKVRPATDDTIIYLSVLRLSTNVGYLLYFAVEKQQD